jgi:hypothetical protein
MNPEVQKATYEVKSKNNGSLWMASVAFILLFLVGGVFACDMELDVPMFGDRIYYLIPTILCLGVIAWAFARNSAIVRIAPSHHPDLLTLDIEGWQAIKADFVPSKVQFWTWMKSENGTMPSYHGYVQVETTEGKKIGFLGDFSDERSTPKDWVRRDPGPPNGVTFYKIHDMILLLDFIRGYVHQP